MASAKSDSSWETAARWVMPPPSGPDAQRRLSTLTQLRAQAPRGALPDQPLVLGFAARVALISRLLPSRRTVRVTSSPVLFSRT